MRGDLASGKGELTHSFTDAVQRVLNEDETYFFVETKVARREIFKDHSSHLKPSQNQGGGDQDFLTKSNTAPACRLAYSPQFKILPVPFGLVTRKGMPPKLMKTIDHV